MLAGKLVHRSRSVLIFTALTSFIIKVQSKYNLLKVIIIFNKEKLVACH